jgi:hypothetical protein
MGTFGVRSALERGSLEGFVLFETFPSNGIFFNNRFLRLDRSFVVPSLFQILRTLEKVIVLYLG